MNFNWNSDDFLEKLAISSDFRLLAEATRLGIDIVTARNSKQETLLHFTAGYGRKRFTSILIERNADIDAKDLRDNTPIHYACMHGHLELVRMLINAKADIHIKNKKGRTAAYYASTAGKNVREILELLIQNGLNPFTRTAGKNCFEIMKPEFRLDVRLMYLKNKLRKESDKDVRSQLKDKYLRPDDFFALIIAEDIDKEIFEGKLPSRLVNSRSESLFNITPLHRAAGYNKLEVAQILIDNGAYIDAQDAQGHVPLHNAAGHGHVEMIELLAHMGCLINAQDSFGMSALHMAAEGESIRCLDACIKLIQAGADITLTTKDSQLPVDLAKTEDVKVLLRNKSSETYPSRRDNGIYMVFNNIYDTLDGDECNYNRPRDSLMLDSRSSDRLYSDQRARMKILVLDQNDRSYQTIEQCMQSTIRNHPVETGAIFSAYEIISIEKLLNETVWKNYKLFCEVIRNKESPLNERMLFHGSAQIEDIKRDGFDHRYSKKGGMFGSGLYFAADSSKSNQCAFGLGRGCKKHQDKSCYICERKMIYAQVALGRTFVSPEARPELANAPPGFFSVSGVPGKTKELMYPEYVIYQGEQAYPLYLITYRIKP